MPIKNEVPGGVDSLRPEYDLSKLAGAVRGKYYDRATAGTTLVLLDPDVADAFPDGRTVNQALRALIKVAQREVAIKVAARARQPKGRAKRKATTRRRRSVVSG